MTKHQDKYFTLFRFTPEQVKGFMTNAERDLYIAKTDTIREVKFNYAYTALIKAGMAWLAGENVKIKSVPGHHVKILEVLAGALRKDWIPAKSTPG